MQMETDANGEWRMESGKWKVVITFFILISRQAFSGKD